MRKNRPIREGDLVRLSTRRAGWAEYTEPGIVVSLSPGKGWKGGDTTVRVIWPDQRESIEMAQCLENLSGRITIAE